MFTNQQENWISHHLYQREGERRRRLQEGYGFGERLFIEKIWFTCFGNFDFLHPEYEVIDYFAGRRFIDFAYIRGGIKIGFEIDGFGPHVTQLSRQQFSDQWVRHMQLVNLGWIMIRISVDDVKERPLLWQQLIQQLLGRYFSQSPASVDSLTELELLHECFRLHRPIRVSDVRLMLSCSYKYARLTIQHFVDHGWLVPNVSGKQRIHCWKLTEKYRLIGTCPHPIQINGQINH